jgi:hypothetical protein
MSLTATKNMGAARKTGIPRFGMLLELSFLIVAGTLLLAAHSQQSIQSLSLIFTSIVLEALPFMLFGSMVGGLVEIFISRERMTALLPKKRPWLSVFIAAGLGLVFPVCECAVVPVVRRLTRKGLPAGAAIAYLLGGPIVNPIVVASTALAYKFDGLIVLLRLGGGYLIAVAVGLGMSRLFHAGQAFRADLHLSGTPSCHCSQSLLAPPAGTGNGRSPHLAEAIPLPFFHEKNAEFSCGCGHDHEAATLGRKLAAACRHAADDFFSVGHFLVIGAFIAALAQTYIDRKIFLGFAGYFGLPSILMMALAILLNLCSEADAFIAASFRGLMPLPAQMAFLLTGPMFDLKLLLMYQSLFRKRTIAVLSVLILVTVLAVALFLELVMGASLS